MHCRFHVSRGPFCLAPAPCHIANSGHCSIPAACTHRWRIRRTRGSSGTLWSRVAGHRYGTEPAEPPAATRLAPPGDHSEPRRRPNHSESTLSVHTTLHRLFPAKISRRWSMLQHSRCLLAYVSSHGVRCFARWNGSIAQPPSQDSMQAARATVRDSVHGFSRSHGGWASNTPQCALWCLLVLMCASCLILCSQWHTISAGRLTCAMQSQPHDRDLFIHCRAARTAAAQPQPWPKRQRQPQPAARANAARASTATSAASSTDSHPAAAADPGAVRRPAVQEVVSASGMGCGSALALQGAPLAPGNHWTTR
jgi:hypothetical protein